jgi:hypothetical protein
VPEPFLQERSDLCIVGGRMTPSQILTHQIDADLKQVERRPERRRGDNGRRNVLAIPVWGHAITVRISIQTGRSMGRGLTARARRS